MSNGVNWPSIFNAAKDVTNGAIRGPALQERIAFLKDRLEAAHQDYERLEAENTQLKAHVADLWRQLQTHLAANEFVEHRGAFFKRLPGGGYHQTVYCPLCKSPAGHSPRMSTNFLCKRTECDWFSDFAADELPQILNELPK